MISGVRVASLAAATTLALSLPAASATAAGPCSTGAQVRESVHTMVDGLRDDVASQPARSSMAQALVNALHTYRGAEATTPAERQALGQQISALVQQRQSATNRVEVKALVVSVKSLREQREPGPFSAADQAMIRSALDALRQAVVDKTDTRAEDRGVAAFFRSLNTQLGCRP